MLSWFEKRIDPFPPERPTQPPAKLGAFLWHYTKPVWPWLALTSVLIAAISGLQVMLFAFLGNLVDWLSAADRETFLSDEATGLFWMGFVILFALPVLSLIHTILMHQTLFGNYPMIMRWKGHRYMLGQSFGFYQDEFAGRVATKVMQTSLGVRETVVKIVDVFIYVGVYFLGTLFLVASLDWLLALPFVLWLAFYVGTLSFFLPKMRVISERQSDARSIMTGRVVDSYTNIQTVKLFAHSNREEEYARESMDQFLQTVHPQMRLVTGMNTCVDLSNSVLLFAVGALGIWSWQTGSVSVGAVAVAVGLVLRLEGIAHWIMWETAGLFENIGTVEDGMRTISTPQSVLDKPHAKTLVVSEGDIKFDGMTFHYGKGKGVIDGLHLHVKPGEKVGLVGRSGAGKSTMMNVLLRLYDLEGGAIRIDGQDIADVTQESLRQQIGVVTQDTSLLHRSVRDNIAYGRPNATDEEIIEAAKRANAHEYIMGLVDLKGRTGYDAHVGERGVKLSGGQRQRIAIARVFLKDAPVLVLDEATSALDSEVEAAIQESLHDLMAGKTVIAIAHRLSTIASLDRLIVLDKGEIVEDGTHDELTEAGGLYADLWARQSGGFLDSEEAAKVAAE
ncbi:MAG: ABC transporter ATP-binding protein [Pseudomonadota bacterium]